jgi:hypothetical protein
MLGIGTSFTKLKLKAKKIDRKRSGDCAQNRRERKRQEPRE